MAITTQLVGKLGGVTTVSIANYNTNQDDAVLYIAPVPSGVSVRFAFEAIQGAAASNDWSKIPSIKFSDGNEIRVYQGLDGRLGYVGQTVGPITVSSFLRGTRQNIPITNIKLHWWAV